jgi:hypothetical protein
MCVSCGCGAPAEKHDNENNLTQQDIEKAAEAAGISVTEVAQNIQESVA